MSRLSITRLLSAGCIVAGCLMAGCAGVPQDRGAIEISSRGWCAWDVCITSRDDELGRVYIARNQEPVPVTIVLEFEFLRGLKPPEDGRIELVIPANSTERIRLSRNLPGIQAGQLGWQVLRDASGISADISISIDLGASSTEPDDHVYAVPFGGSAARPLIQGFNGDGTHMGDMRYALDFAMPLNTPIFAARERGRPLRAGWVHGGRYGSGSAGAGECGRRGA